MSTNYDNDEGFFETFKSYIIGFGLFVTGALTWAYFGHSQNEHAQDDLYKELQKRTYALHTLQQNGDTITVNNEKYLISNQGRIALYVDDFNAVKIVKGIAGPSAAQEIKGESDGISFPTPMGVGISSGEVTGTITANGDREIDKHLNDVPDVLFSPGFTGYPERGKCDDVLEAYYSQRISPNSSQAGDFFHEEKVVSAFRVQKLIP